MVLLGAGLFLMSEEPLSGSLVTPSVARDRWTTLDLHPATTVEEENLDFTYDVGP